jgi:G:T/U-mismatch repair DNA glycosylase
MSTVILNSFTQETHPWGRHIPSDANKLLIGTFPTDIRNRKHNFFYCSSTNRFWEVLSSVAGHPIKLPSSVNAIEERKNILDKLKLGLTDMGKIIYRLQGSSKDHSIFPIEFMDIIQILNEFPSINSLIVSGNKHGNSSLSWFSIFCNLNNITINVKQLVEQRVIQIKIADRKINVLLAYSPSRLSRVTTEKLIDDYRSILIN